MTNNEQSADVQQYIRSLEPSKMLVIIEKEYEPQHIAKGENLFRFQYRLLHFYLSNESHRMWEALTNTESRKSKMKGVLDRDTEILELWNKLDKEKVKLKFYSIIHHQDYLFHWFLIRYNIGGAWQAFGYDKSINRYIWGLGIFNFISGLLGIILILWYQCYYMTLSIPVFILCMDLVVFLVRPFNRTDMDWRYKIHSLVPRIFFTVGLGYLFLLSVPELLEFIFKKHQCLNLILSIVLLFIAIITYLILSIDRILKPRLKWRELSKRTGFILLLGAGYSVIWLMPAYKIIISGVYGIANFQWLGLIPLALSALLLGIILQSAWEEKSLTEPL